VTRRIGLTAAGPRIIGLRQASVWFLVRPMGDISGDSWAFTEGLKPVTSGAVSPGREKSPRVAAKIAAKYGCDVSSDQHFRHASVGPPQALAPLTRISPALSPGTPPPSGPAHQPPCRTSALDQRLCPLGR